MTVLNVSGVGRAQTIDLLVKKCVFSLQAVDLASLFSHTASKKVVPRPERSQAPLTFVHRSLQVVALLDQSIGFYMAFTPRRTGTLILVLSKLHERARYLDPTPKLLLKLVSTLLLDPQDCFHVLVRGDPVHLESNTLVQGSDQIPHRAAVVG